MLISRKIITMVAVAMIASGAVAGFGILGLKRVNQGMVEIGEQSMPAVLFVSDLRSTYLSVIPEAYSRVGAETPEAGKDIETRINGITDGLMMKVNSYAAKPEVSDEEKAALREAKVGLIGFTAQIHDVGLLVDEGKTREALNKMRNDFGPLHQGLAKAFDNLVKINTTRVGALVEQADGTFTQTLSASIAAAVTGVLIIAVMGLVIGRSIVRPLGIMQRAITRTATELDFTADIASPAKDEIGRTLRSYDELLISLRCSFGGIQEMATRLATLTGEVDATAKDIAHNSIAQSDAASGVAAAVEQLTVSISMVAAQAEEASLHTRESRDKADTGAEVILATIARIQTISDSVRQVSSKIDALRTDSDSISSVANIIKEIADQTNLLALNAAIEAARAGEQGRGFAVVADEVRKLAERTSKSTLEISQLLTQIQKGAREAVETMGVAVQEVDAGVESARIAGESVQAIRDGSSGVVATVGEISAAVREQTAASAAISQRIEQISQMTERNSSAAEATSHTVHDMTEVSLEIHAALSSYKV